MLEEGYEVEVYVDKYVYVWICMFWGVVFDFLWVVCVVGVMMGCFVCFYCLLYGVYMLSIWLG